jgi:hypothetical protein
MHPIRRCGVKIGAIRVMKRWAILTVLLYALALLVLTFPVIAVAFGNWGLKNDGTGLKGALAIYANWAYWVWLAVLVAGQFLLLLLPIDLSERRLPSRRKLKIPVIVTTFFLMNLFLAGLLSILCAIFKEGGFGIFAMDDLIGRLANALNHLPPPTTQDSDWQSSLSFLVPVLIFWLVWAVIFRRATRSDDPDALLKRATRWLLRGSILELIVAVPSHVIARRRDDCCAPAGTFWGIATGISVMLLCFGPGVYFLFVERMKKLRPADARSATPPKK